MLSQAISFIYSADNTPHSGCHCTPTTRIRCVSLRYLKKRCSHTPTVSARTHDDSSFRVLVPKGLRGGGREISTVAEESKQGKPRNDKKINAR